PLEQAMRDIRAEQKLRPEEAGRLNVVSEKQLAIGTVAQDARMSKKPPHDLLTAALQYAAVGLSVVPVHSINGDGWCSCRDGKSCASPGKHPRTQNGIRDTTPDPTEIERFRSKWPDATIGIAMGPASGIAVIDIDPRNDGLETFENLEADLGRLPKTPMARTGGDGAHLMFNLPQIALRKAAAGPGVDVLGGGCLMGAPPRRHASGDRYSWEEGRSPDDIRAAARPRKWRGGVGA